MGAGSAASEPGRAASASGRACCPAKNSYYYDRLKRLLRFIVEPGKRVLEIRYQTGHLLAAVEPAYGVGVDISERLVQIARFEALIGKSVKVESVDQPRIGDHICYISNLRRLKTDYPKWKITRSLDDICRELASAVQQDTR